MAVPKISLKTMDYYKFRKLIIDGNRDDYETCSREVRLFCDNVATFYCRDDVFDDDTDKQRFDEICCFYRQMLSGGRVSPIDVRIKSGWWGDQKGSSYSVGKIKSSALKDLLVVKTCEWFKRKGADDKKPTTVAKQIEGAGIFVFKHREKKCFQFVGRAAKTFAACAEMLRLAFEGKSVAPLSSLFVISLANDWEFYFTPVQTSGKCALYR